MERGAYMHSWVQHGERCEVPAFNEAVRLAHRSPGSEVVGLGPARLEIMGQED